MSVQLPLLPPAMLARIAGGKVVVAAVPVGFAVPEASAPEWRPESGLTLTANPMRLWWLREAEAAWYVKDGEWVSFSVPPAIMLLDEVARTAWGIGSPYPAEIERFSSLCSWVSRNDAEEAEVHALDTALREAGIHPGWPIVPRTREDP